jgi:tRNA dimethylallyltransferase
MVDMNTLRPMQGLISIVGPTGIGKTALAVQLGKHFDAEVVNADSRQIYRQMNIGTAKPTAEERAAIPHHLIDIVDPDQPLTMAEYQSLAYAAIDDIHRRGKIALLVGGTGQYVTAVLEGWQAPEVPPNEALRTELEAFASEHGALPLFERLRELDPESGERMDPHNVRRTIRALEVCIVTGKPFSAQRTKSPPPYQVLELGLTIADRESLYNRLDERIDRMVEAGLVDEVRRLRDQGYDWRLPSMSGLGYAQFRPLFEGEATLEDCIAAIKHDTRTFVRRQYTWFRRHGSPQWFESPSIDEIYSIISQRFGINT